MLDPWCFLPSRYFCEMPSCAAVQHVPRSAVFATRTRHLGSFPLAGLWVLLSFVCLLICSLPSFLLSFLPPSLYFLPSLYLSFFRSLACFSMHLFSSPPIILVLNNAGTTQLDLLTPIPICQGLTHSSRSMTSMSPNLMVSHQALINLTQQQHLIQSNHSLCETYSSLGF